MNDTDFGFGDFMQEIEEHILHITKEAARAPKDIYEEWQAFSSAIKWEENWIRSILIFHLILFFIGLIWRKNLEVQMGIFSIICLIVFFCERINSLCSENWYEFATQNYFDEHGVFMGVIVCAPLLTIGFLQLLNLLVLASGALIKAKRMKLQRDRNDKKHEEKKRDEIESSTSTRVLRKRRKK